MKKTTDLLERYEFRLISRDPQASKTDYGKLLIIGGSFGMAGAAYLSGLAAFRAGIGMVRFYGPECNRQILQTLLPEAMYTVDRYAKDEEIAGAEPSEEQALFDAAALKKALSWADYVICGPGLSQSAYAKALVGYLLSLDFSDKKLILFDADALNIIASERFSIKQLAVDRSRKRTGKNIVLTPHIGEMSRLTGKTISAIKKNRGKTAKEFAAANGCTVVLKDAASFVAVSDGTVYENLSGSPALAKAGSGDVLTGVIAGVTAVTGGNAEAGAILGTFLHGKAGEMAELYQGVHSVLARDVADAVSGVLGDFCVKYQEVFDRLDDLMDDLMDEKDDCDQDSYEEDAAGEDLFDPLDFGDGILPEPEEEELPFGKQEEKTIPFRKKNGRKKT